MAESKSGAYLFLRLENGHYAVSNDPSGVNLPPAACLSGWRYIRALDPDVNAPLPFAANPEPILRALQDDGYWVAGETGETDGTSNRVSRRIMLPRNAGQAGATCAPLLSQRSAARPSDRLTSRSHRSALLLEKFTPIPVGLAPRRRLDLDPADVLARLVGLVAKLRHDALKPHLRGDGEELFRIIEFV